MKTSNTKFRLYFVINEVYHAKNTANTISEVPFWYCESEFKAINPLDATQFDDPNVGVRKMTKHANSEPLLDMMLEFYDYSFEVRRIDCLTWAPISVYQQINGLLKIK